MPRFKLNDDIELYYEIFGPELGQPDVQTMFFAHGGPGFVDGRSYHDFWAQFASDKTRVIFPDQRGSGRSDDPADISTLNIEQHAKDMHALCKHLGIENPIVAGVSQGGYVAISYAAQFPNEIARLIICNSEAKRETEERVKACRHSLEAFFGLSAEEAEDLSEKIRIFDEHWDWEAYAQLFGSFYSKKGESFTAAPHEITWNKFMGEEFGLFDLRPALCKIICPTLYMAGEFDCIHPPECAKKTKNLMINSDIDFHILLDAADPVYVDQWEKATQLVSDFLLRNN